MNPDVVIVGAGLAGSAAAIRLARAGRRTVVLERSTVPGDTVCGEFLSADAVESLEALGLDLAALGARPLDRLRLFAGTRQAECELPFRAFALPRRALDPALRALASAAGADLRLGVAARRIEGTRVDLADGGSLSAGAVMLASGKHELRGSARRTGGAPTVGFKQHLALGRKAMDELGSAVELHLFDGGYAGLLPVGADTANLCIAVRQNRLAQAGRSLDGLLRSVAADGTMLARRLAEASAVTPRPVAVSGIPYGYRAWRSPDPAEQVWRLGDQAVVTPSFTGDGMAIALASANLAAGALIESASREAYLAALRAAVGGQMRRAAALESILDRPWSAELVLRLGAFAPGLFGMIAAATRLPRTR